MTVALGGGSDAWNALEQLLTFAHGRTGGDVGFDRGFDDLDLVVEVGDVPLGARPDVFLDDPAALVFRRDPGIDELPPVQGERLQTRFCGARQRRDTGPCPFAEGGEDPGVDRVGLGEAADAFGEVTDLARIDACDRHVLGRERRHDRHLVAAGRLDDHDFCRQFFQLAGEPFASGLVIGDRKRFPGRVGMKDRHVQRRG